GREAGVRAAQLAHVARRWRPHPPLLAGVARRDVQGARPAELAGRQILHEGAMLASRIVLFEDLRLARRATIRVESLQGHEAPPIDPGPETNAVLRLVNDLTAPPRR